MDPFNSSINSMDQLDDMYDFQDPVLNSMAPPSFNRSSSLTPLLSSWNVTPPSPQKIHTLKNLYNNDLSLDSIIDFMEPSSVDQAIHFSPVPHNSQQTSPNSPTTSQQDPNVNSPLLEYDVFNADVPFDFDTWNVLCSNDMYLSSSDPLSCSASETGSYINRQSTHQENISQSQQNEQEYAQNSQLSMGNKRKAVGNQCVEVNRKKRVVSRTQQQKKDIISCVIANLPADVIEEQQKAIPTAFPSRMRQTRIQAALKAQTDAMVQSCQQRIMKNTVNEITAPVSGQCSDMNGDAVQYIGAYTLEERRIRIARFREKRKHRVWDHAVKYNCRRKLAVGRVRVKGRFVKSGDDVQK